MRLLRKLYYTLTSLDIMVTLFKIVWIAACVYFFREINTNKSYIAFFTISALLLYKNEGEHADISFFRKRYRRPKGILILIPFVCIIGYIYSLFDLNFVTLERFDKELLLGEFAEKAIFISGCTFLMIVLFCRLRALRYFGGYYVQVLYCILICGTFWGLLIGHVAYIPMGIIIAFLYEKFNFPIIISLCSVLCLVAPFWDYALLFVVLSAVILVLTRNKITNYGNPVFLRLDKVDGLVL